MWKTCNKCMAEKPLEAFSRDARRKDGLNLTCKPCRKAYITARKAKKGEGSTYIGAPCKNGHKGLRLRTSGNCIDCLKEWREANRDKLLAQARAKYHRDPERYREAGRRWRKANPGASAEKSRQYAAKNRERIRELNRRWRELNRGKLLAKQREYWAANRDRLLERHKEWRAQNADHIKTKQREKYLRRRKDPQIVAEDRLRAKTHYEQNRGYYAIKTKARRKIEKTAMPTWLSAKQAEEIERIYMECAKLTADTGIKHEVDHIVPLCGHSVSGLHVPWNLQILTAEENRAKGNKHGDE